MSSFGDRKLGSAVSRRAVLRGAGVALALPWLESLIRPARAQAMSTPKRFVAIYLPCGAPYFWVPPTPGVGSGWQLSSLLEPLAALKSKVTLIGGLENGSAFNADGSSSVEPSNGRQCGAWLTCTDAAVIRKRTGVTDSNGVSADQVMAAHPAFAGKTAFPSLQVGLSTVHSSCNEVPCSTSRSVSWKTETLPLYKTVDPNVLFDQLTGAGPDGTPGQFAAQRDSRISVLDAVQETTAVARARLNPSDKLRMDEYLDAVRSVEKSVKSGMKVSCPAMMKPNFPPISGDGIRQNDATYDKSVHADLMNELLALSLQCDQTRIASYMLEDEKSEFIYDFVPKRTFSTYTSAPSTGFCPEWYNGGQGGAVDDYASIVHWHVGKVAEFCKRLDGMKDDNGLSVLDNSVVLLGASMHGQDHACENLPTVLMGGGGGRLKTDQYLALQRRPMRDFYITLMNDVYDLALPNFGVNLTGAPLNHIPQLLA